MKNTKKFVAALIAVATTASLAVTAFAADYGSAPTFVPEPNSGVSVSASELNDAVTGASDTATVEVKTIASLPVSSKTIKELVKEGKTLEIVSSKATITVDPSTVTKVKKIDLSMKVISTTSKTRIKMRSKKDFGCDVKITVTDCKMSADALAKAHVYCNGEDLGAVELDENGNPVITVTKGGTYEIK